MSLLQKISSPEDVKKLNSKEVRALCEEIRSFLVKNVMNCGGHLASNLGVVEVVVELLRQFDFPKDKIIFDVGHQCYVYKMLTGRMQGFSALRHLGGISGFPRTSESEYDAFDVGHAGTSISAAIGMARARDLDGSDERIIAFVGDGALANGMNFEALNDIGQRKTGIIILLNDNEMSIDKNVGGLSAHLTKLRFAPRYIHTKSNVQDFLSRFGGLGKGIVRMVRGAKDKLKYAAISAPLFEQLGLTYMGIIDGNNPDEVAEALKRAKTMDGPVVIHVFTKKGLGYEEAENNPSKFHGVSSNTARISPKDISYDKAFSSFIKTIGDNNPKAVTITAAMASGCGLMDFAEHYPERFFDVGIAEEHAVTMAAGMAKGGLVPVVCVYSTFLQRSYDQIVHDVCLQNLHVVFAIGHAGLTGEDGETHQGLLDLSMLSHIPNMTVLAPSTYEELKIMMDYAVNEHTGPIAVRYPKAAVSFRSQSEIRATQPEKIIPGDDILILSCGRMTDTALDVAKKLSDDGISVSVVNIRCVKPVDTDFIDGELKGKKLVVTIEDNITAGGMGQYVLSQINTNAGTLVLGFDTCFVPHGKQEELFEIYGLDTESVYNKIKTFYKGMTL